MSLVREIHALVCCLHGVGFKIDGEDRLCYGGFACSLVQRDLFIHAEKRKLSFTLYDLPLEDPPKLFSRINSIFLGFFRSYIYTPSLTSHKPLPLSLSVLDLALVLGELYDVHHMACHKHRVHVRFAQRGKRFGLDFTGTLATARCITCRRRRRCCHTEVHVKDGFVKNASVLLLFFHRFHREHRHIEPCHPNAPNRNASCAREQQENNGTTCTQGPSPVKSNPPSWTTN